MKKIIFLIITIFTYSTLISNNIKKDSILKESVELKKKDTLILSENDTYKLLYENTKESNEKILATIYWSLSLITAVILAIIGSSIFFNFKFNKKEIENVLTENDKILEKIKNDHLLIIDSRLDNYEKESKIILKKENSELKKTYQELIKSYNDNLNSQLDSQKELLDEKLKIYNKKFDDYRETQKADKTKIFDEIEMQTNRVEMLLSNVEAKVWEQKEVYGNALTCYIEEGLLSLKIDFGWNLKYVLPNIILMIKKIEEIDKYDSENLADFISEIPSEYSKLKRIISELLEKIPIKK